MTDFPRNYNRAIATEEKMSKENCEFKFKQTLRNNLEEKEYIEKKPLKENKPINPKKLQEQESDIFIKKASGNPECAKKQLPHLRSNVLFNDDYVEQNPKINKGKTVKYQREKELKEIKNLYSDEPNFSDSRKQRLERKINDNFNKNPMKILDKIETSDLNKIMEEKNAKKKEVYEGFLGSQNTKKLVGGYCKENSRLSDKITNNDFNITEKAKEINKANVPENFNIKQFKVMPCGDDGKKGLTYL